MTQLETSQIRTSILIACKDNSVCKRLKELVDRTTEVRLAGICRNKAEVLRLIKQKEPSLIFLSTHFNKYETFSLLEKMPSNLRPYIVFISTTKEFAYTAFCYEAFDYLKLPIDSKRFYKIISRYFKLEMRKEINDKVINSSFSKPENSNSFSKLAVKMGRKIQFVKEDEIKYITASGHYAEIHVGGEKYLMRESLNNLISNKLNTNNFVRIHRSTVINIHMVKQIISSDYSEVDVIMDDKKRFRISLGHKINLLEKLGVSKM